MIIGMEHYTGQLSQQIAKALFDQAGREEDGLLNFGRKRSHHVQLLEVDQFAHLLEAKLGDFDELLVVDAKALESRGAKTADEETVLHALAEARSVRDIRDALVRHEAEVLDRKSVV